MIMMTPGAFAEIFIALSGLAHLVSGLILGGIFALPSLFVRWKAGGTLAGALMRSQVPALLAAGPSLLGLLLCGAGFVLVLLTTGDPTTREMLQDLALYSVIVPPLPGFALGFVAFLLFRRVASVEGEV
jgi:hypothetical protein